MFRKILLCYDGTEEGRNALKAGADVALCMQAEAYLLAIIRPRSAPIVPEGYSEAWFRHEDDAAKAILDEGVTWLKDHGLEAHGNLAFGNAIEEIVHAAHSMQPDLIVVGHRRRSRLARWWSEGEDATLLDLLSCSVLVAVRDVNVDVNADANADTDAAV
jgi:nucleotide-binding universal stress UspA family protein